MILVFTSFARLQDGLAATRVQFGRGEAGGTPLAKKSCKGRAARTLGGVRYFCLSGGTAPTEVAARFLRFFLQEA